MNNRYVNQSDKFTRSIIIALTIILLNACGGGGSDSPSTTATKSISGTAAAGAPLIADIVVKDANGTIRSVSTDLSGNFTVNVSDLTPPIMLRAKGCTATQCYTIHSATAELTDGGNTVNITPLTDLIISGVASALAENYFDSGDFSSLSTTSLATEEQNLQSRIQSVLNVLGVGTSVDLLYDQFSADHSGLDAALDLLTISTDTTTNIATITNLITSESFTDNLTSAADNSDIGLTDTTGMNNGLTALQAIAQAVDSLDTFLEEHPTDWLTQADLSQHLDSSAWMDYGENYTQLIANTEFPKNLRISSWALLNLDETAGEALIVMRLRKSSTGSISTVPWWVFYDSTNSLWKFAGNQYKVDINVASIATLTHHFDSSTQSTSSSIESGIEIYINDTEGYSPNSISLATVIGPGINTTINFGGDTEGWQHITWNSSMTDNADYIVTLYDGATTLDSYTIRVASKPESPAALSTADFAAINQPTPSSLDTFSTSGGGNLTLQWSMPNHLAADWASLYASDGSNDISAEKELSTNSGSTTLNLDLSGLTSTPEVELEIESVDIVTGRQHSTVISNY
jgi:uncharacterized spore protein YtfJ